MSPPLPRETLLAAGRCCGHKCFNCPYIPKHIAGTKQVQPVCFVCRNQLQEIRGKLICKICHTINETCCDGGQCRS